MYELLLRSKLLIDCLNYANVHYIYTYNTLSNSVMTFQKAQKTGNEMSLKNSSL